MKNKTKGALYPDGSFIYLPNAFRGFAPPLPSLTEYLKDALKESDNKKRFDRINRAACMLKDEIESETVFVVKKYHKGGNVYISPDSPAHDLCNNLIKIMFLDGEINFDGITLAAREFVEKYS